MNEKLDINEIIILPVLGFRVSGGSDNNYSQLQEYIDQNENLEYINLVYQNEIGFTIQAKDTKELQKILKELDKFIAYEYEDNLSETLIQLLSYNKQFLNGFK